MALATLFPNRPARRSQIGDLTFDATVSEQHERTSEATRFPVETGATITDHIRAEPESVTLTGVVADLRANGGGAMTDGHAQDAFDFLEALHQSRELVSLVTGYKVYEDMAVARLSIPRDRQTGDALHLTMELQKILKATTKSVPIPADALATETGPAAAADPIAGAKNGVKDQAQSTQDVGKTVPAPVSQSTTPGTTAPAKTGLATLYDKGFGKMVGK